MAKRQEKSPAKAKEEMQAIGGAHHAEVLQVAGAVNLDRLLAVREKAQGEPYILEAVAIVPNRLKV